MTGSGDLEAVLADLLHRFAKLPAEDVFGALAYAQQRVCAVLDVDVSSIYQQSPDDPASFVLTHLYNRGVAPQRPDTVSAGTSFPWAEQQLRSARLLVINSIEDLPPEAAHDQAIWRAYGITSSLAFALVGSSDDELGFISFDRTSAPRPWTHELVERLGIVAQIFASALSSQKTERARRESESHFQQLSDHALVGIYIVQNGRISYCNNALANIFGYSPGELIGADPLDMVDADDRAIVVEDMRSLVAGEETRQDYEVRCRHRDGSLLYIEVHGAPIEMSGRPAVIGNLSDVTARHNADEALRQALDLAKQLLADAILTLSKVVETRDAFTAGQQQRVAALAVAIADELGLDQASVEELRIAALLHDVGTMQIPADLLNKSSSLTKPEMALMKTHARASYDIVSTMSRLPRVAEIVLQHHERLDGTGYPGALRDEQICFGARLLAVADVVEAMLSERPYRAALGLDATVAEIVDHRGTLYDADVVDACVQLITEGRFSFPEYAAR